MCNFKKSVCILLGTFNGEKYLAEQLNSIANQSHVNWKVVASDDGSSDSTLEILKQYQIAWGIDRLEIREGPKKGFAKNFLNLASDPKLNFDYYAFCDQDDVWMPLKLETAINYLMHKHQNIPRLYCGRTYYVSENLIHLGMSQLFSFPRSFRNALVQSIAGGNTMVFNQSVKNIFEITKSPIVASHDWWTYLLVEAVGGEVYYDPVPQVLYRQHPAALVGANTSMKAKFNRLFFAFMGRFKKWNDLHVSALASIVSMMPSHNRDIYNEFVRLRNSHVLHRFRMIEICGIYRQTWQGTVALYVAAILKKI